MPLRCDQARRKLAAEPFAVEMVVGDIEAGIGPVHRGGSHERFFYGSYDPIPDGQETGRQARAWVTMRTSWSMAIVNSHT
jgi:hypothetical protein